MYLNNLVLTNFRNYKKTEIDFAEHLNFLIGDNTQGKSNLIEAIYLLLTFRSPRTNHYEDMIKWGTDFFYLKGTVVEKQKKQIIEVIGEKGKGKRARFNQKIQSHTDSTGKCLPVVIFTPEDFNIIKGSPSDRRDFLDLLISQTDNKYSYFLKQYKKILHHKNIILQNKLTQKYNLLETWNAQLINYGVEIIIKRHAVVKKLNKLTQKNYPEIYMPEDIEILYNTFLPEEMIKDKERIKTEWQKTLCSQREEEIKKGISISGPHRDNLQFLLNQKESSSFASRGQIKTILLAVNMAEIEFIYAETGEFPVVLLDELFSELDDKRIKNVLDILPGNIQIFITEINDSKIRNKEGNWFTINQGVINKRGQIIS